MNINLCMGCMREKTEKEHVSTVALTRVSTKLRSISFPPEPC